MNENLEQQNVAPDSKQETITFLKDLAKTKSFIDTVSIKQEEREIIQKIISLWRDKKIWYISILEKTKTPSLGNLSMLIDELYRIDQKSIELEIKPLLKQKQNKEMVTTISSNLGKSWEIKDSSVEKRRNLLQEISQNENPKNKIKEKTKKLLEELSNVSDDSRFDSWLDVSDFWWKQEVKSTVSQLLRLLWKDRIGDLFWKVLSLRELNELVEELDEKNIDAINELEEINSYIEDELKDLKENVEENRVIWNDEANYSKDTKEIRWWTKFYLAWIPIPFMDQKTNEYMNNPQTIELLRNKDFSVIKKIVEDLNKSLNWATTFEDYILTNNYSQIEPIIKKAWYDSWLWFWSKEASLLVSTLRNYVKMQEEIIPQLDEEKTLEILLDNNKDWILSSKTTSVSWNEYWNYSSIFRWISKPKINILIKNLWFSSFEDLKSSMQNNLFLTRELFQNQLNSLSSNGLDTKKILEPDILNNKVKKQVNQLKNSNERDKNKMKEVVSIWILKYVWSKFAPIEWIPDFIKLPEDAKRMYETLLQKLEPMYVWVNYWLDSWISWSVSYPTPEIISDFLNDFITPNSISTSFWASWINFSINKDLFKEFLSKHDASLTLTLLNWFMPVLTWSQWFEVRDLWDIKSMFQEKAKKTWFKWRFYLSLSPFTKTVNMWVNVWIEDEDTSAWIEKMTIKAWKYFEAMWESILKNEKAEVFVAKFDWTKKDILAYEHIKSTFDNVTSSLSSKDKDLYMKNLFMKWYVDSFRNHLYELASWKLFINSFWVWVSNTFWEYIVSSLKQNWKNTVMDSLEKAFDWKIDPLLFWDKVSEQVGTEVDKWIEKANKETYWISDLVLSWWLNPVPYLSIWGEYKTIKYVPLNNHSLQYDENMRRVKLEDLWSKWDIKIDKKGWLDILSIKSWFIDSISAPEGKVQAETNNWKLCVWWVNLSDCTIYEKTDKKTTNTLVIWPWEKNNKWDFLKANQYLPISSGVKNDTNWSIFTTSSHTTYVPDIDVTYFWASFDTWELLRNYISKRANDQITEECYKKVHSILKWMESSWLNPKVIIALANIVDTVKSINVSWFKDWSINASDLKELKKIFDSFNDNQLTLEEVAKINLTDFSKATWITISSTVTNSISKWLEKASENWITFKSISSNLDKAIVALENKGVDGSVTYEEIAWKVPDVVKETISTNVGNLWNVINKTWEQVTQVLQSETVKKIIPWNVDNLWNVISKAWEQITQVWESKAIKDAIPWNDKSGWNVVTDIWGFFEDVWNIFTWDWKNKDNLQNNTKIPPIAKN